MKLRQIIENSEYAGLEDADEFEDGESCSECGAPRTDYHSWCQASDPYGNDSCNRTVCGECLHGQVKAAGGDPNRGIAPNGWFYDNGFGNYLCPEHADQATPDGRTNNGIIGSL